MQIGLSSRTVVPLLDWVAVSLKKFHNEYNPGNTSDCGNEKLEQSTTFEGGHANESLRDHL